MRKSLLLVGGLLAALLLVRPLLALEARAWSSPEQGPALALSETMDNWARQPPEGLGLAPLGIEPPAELYEAEWRFATWNMAASGHADPDNRHAAQHDRMVAFLSRRMRQGRPLLATYTGQAYPADHAASIATVALHARATGQPEPAWLQAHLAEYRRRFVDEQGLLIQAASPSGSPRSVARGWDTALAAYFLAFADPELSADLGRAIQEHLATTELGISAVREYAPETCAADHPCQGDVDSGPLVMGTSVSATGFALATARHQDPAWFARLWATTRSFDAWQGDRFATGGPLGNAILFAMLTAPPLEPATP